MEGTRRHAEAVERGVLIIVHVGGRGWWWGAGHHLLIVVVVCARGVGCGVGWGHGDGCSPLRA